MELSKPMSFPCPARGFHLSQIISVYGGRSGEGVGGGRERLLARGFHLSQIISVYVGTWGM